MEDLLLWQLPLIDCLSASELPRLGGYHSRCGAGVDRHGGGWLVGLICCAVLAHG